MPKMDKQDRTVETTEMIVKRVSVPVGLEELMEGLAKEVLLKKPDDIYIFAAKYFSKLLLLRDKGNHKVKTIRSAQTVAEHNRRWLSKKYATQDSPKSLYRQASVRSETPKQPTKDSQVKKEKPSSRKEVADKTTVKSESLAMEGKQKHMHNKSAYRSMSIERPRNIHHRERSQSSTERVRVVKPITGQRKTPAIKERKIRSSSMDGESSSRSDDSSRSNKSSKRDSIKNVMQKNEKKLTEDEKVKNDLRTVVGVVSTILALNQTPVTRETTEHVLDQSVDEVDQRISGLSQDSLEVESKTETPSFEVNKDVESSGNSKSNSKTDTLISGQINALLENNSDSSNKLAKNNQAASSPEVVTDIVKESADDNIKNDDVRKQDGEGGFMSNSSEQNGGSKKTDVSTPDDAAITKNLTSIPQDLVNIESSIEKNHNNLTTNEDKLAEDSLETVKDHLETDITSKEDSELKKNTHATHKNERNENVKELSSEAEDNKSESVIKENVELNKEDSDKLNTDKETLEKDVSKIIVHDLKSKTISEGNIDLVSNINNSKPISEDLAGNVRNESGNFKGKEETLAKLSSENVTNDLKTDIVMEANAAVNKMSNQDDKQLNTEKETLIKGISEPVVHILKSPIDTKARSDLNKDINEEVNNALSDHSDDTVANGTNSKVNSKEQKLSSEIVVSDTDKDVLTNENKNLGNLSIENHDEPMADNLETKIVSEKGNEIIDTNEKLVKPSSKTVANVDLQDDVVTKVSNESILENPPDKEKTSAKQSEITSNVRESLIKEENDETTENKLEEINANNKDTDKESHQTIAENQIEAIQQTQLNSKSDNNENNKNFTEQPDAMLKEGISTSHIASPKDDVINTNQQEVSPKKVEFFDGNGELITVAKNNDSIDVAKTLISHLNEKDLDNTSTVKGEDFIEKSSQHVDVPLYESRKDESDLKSLGNESVNNEDTINEVSSISENSKSDIIVKPKDEAPAEDIEIPKNSSGKELVTHLQNSSDTSAKVDEESMAKEKSSHETFQSIGADKSIKETEQIQPISADDKGDAKHENNKIIVETIQNNTEPSSVDNHVLSQNKQQTCEDIDELISGNNDHEMPFHMTHKNVEEISPEGKVEHQASELSIHNAEELVKSPPLNSSQGNNSSSNGDLEKLIVKKNSTNCDSNNNTKNFNSDSSEKISTDSIVSGSVTENDSENIDQINDKSGETKEMSENSSTTVKVEDENIDMDAINETIKVLKTGVINRVVKDYINTFINNEKHINYDSSSSRDVSSANISSEGVETRSRNEVSLSKQKSLNSQETFQSNEEIAFPQNADTEKTGENEIIKQEAKEVKAVKTIAEGTLNTEPKNASENQHVSSETTNVKSVAATNSEERYTGHEGNKKSLSEDESSKVAHEKIKDTKSLSANEKVHKSNEGPLSTIFNSYKSNGDIYHDDNNTRNYSQNIFNKAFAVLKIQSMWRGFSVRKSLNRPELLPPNHHTLPRSDSKMEEMKKNVKDIVESRLKADEKQREKLQENPIKDEDVNLHTKNNSSQNDEHKSKTEKHGEELKESFIENNDVNLHTENNSSQRVENKGNTENDIRPKSIDSAESVVTVVHADEPDSAQQKQETEEDFPQLSSNIDEIDAIQNKLLEQIAGKNVGTDTKIDSVLDDISFVNDVSPGIMSPINKENKSGNLSPIDEQQEFCGTRSSFPSVNKMIDDKHLAEYVENIEDKNNENKNKNNLANMNKHESSDVDKVENAALGNLNTNRTSPGDNFTPYLMHTGELHDTMIIPTINDKIESSKQTVDENLKKESEKVVELSTQKLKDSGLIHTGELHDSLVLPIDTMKINTDKDEFVDSVEKNSAKIIEESKKMYASSGLRHSGELHDSLEQPLPLSGQESNSSEVPQSAESRNDASTVTSQPTTTVESVTERRDTQSPIKLGSATPISDKNSNSKSSVVARDSMENKRTCSGETHTLKPNQGGPDMESQAATKIQAGFRGYQVRKQLKNKNGSSDIATQRRSGRPKSGSRIDSGKSTSCQKPKEIEEKSAIKIQAGVRGFLVRRRQKKDQGVEGNN